MRLPVRSILTAAFLLLTLGTLAVVTLPNVADFVAGVTGLRPSTLRALLDPLSGKIQLKLLPSGHLSGLDADTVDGLHASSFAQKSDFDATTADLSKKILDLSANSDAGFLGRGATSADSARLGGQLPSYYQNASNINAGTLSTLRLSSNVDLIDLAQTFTATKTFSAGLTVLAGAVTLPTGSIADSALSSNVGLLTGPQTFTGAKTFSAAITFSGFSTAGLVTNTSAGLLGTLAGTTTTVLHGNAAGLPTFGQIANADVASAAAVAYSKLNLTGSIVGGDLAPNIAISTSGNLTTTGNASIGGTLALPTLTQGSVVFAGAGGLLSQNNSNFFWDNSNSRLGIGTTGPGKILDLRKDQAADTSIRITNNTAASGSNAAIIFSDDQITETFKVGIDRNSPGAEPFLWIPGANDLRVFTNALERFRISSGGNVGIGTAGPGFKLDVNGTLNASGAATLGSTLGVTGAITAPTSSNTLNGLIVSSGNATLANLTTSTGSLTSTLSDSGTAVGFVLGTSTSYVTAGAKLLQLKNNTTVALTLDKDGNLTAGGNIVATGTLQGTQLISTIATGTAPLVVTSTTQVTNLNSNFVQGFQAADLYSVPQPNLIPNSDFSRRTVQNMLAMPEVFADTSGGSISGSTASAASNILTIATTNGVWSEGLPTWRDGRWSATAKVIDTAQTWELMKWVDSNNAVEAVWTGGNFLLRKRIAGVVTDVQTVAQAITLNRWIWLELEAQGTTYIAKLYDTGSLSPGTAKSASPLLQTLVFTISESAVVAGQLALRGSANNTQWGGIAASPGGVYVEIWGPETLGFPGSINWGAVAGGQAFGIDETADAGPIGKQWAMRFSIPATNRIVSPATAVRAASVVPSTSYTLSAYLKTSGYSGTGTLIRLNIDWKDSNNAFISTMSVTDAAETVWTRKTTTATSPANARYADVYIQVNPSSTATGTAWIMSGQLEQGSVATPWRNAPEDFADLVYDLSSIAGDVTRTGASYAELDSRNAAANISLPWDATVNLLVRMDWTNTVSTHNRLSVYIDGVLSATDSTTYGYLANVVTVGNTHGVTFALPVRLSAGKHRIALAWATDAGTATGYASANGRRVFTITATKGK